MKLNQKINKALGLTTYVFDFSNRSEYSGAAVFSEKYPHRPIGINLGGFLIMLSIESLERWAQKDGYDLNSFLFSVK